MPAISTAVGLGLAAASAASKGIGAAKAAGAQKSGAEQALAVQQQNQAKAIAAQQPYATAGQQGVNTLAQRLSTPGQGLLQGFDEQFQAPTLEQAQQTPGYQFALNEGIGALDKSAAAKGNLFSGSQGKALEQYGQGLADQNYQQIYNNAMGEYQNRFNVFETNQGNEYNRLMGLTGVGQNAANAEGKIYTDSGNSQASQINNAAAARASGYAGVGDAISGGLNYGADTALQMGQQPNRNLFENYDPKKWVNQGGYVNPANDPSLNQPPPQIPGVNYFG